MNHLTSGITPVSPSYPVRPAQPTNKDREPGKKHPSQQEKRDKETPRKRYDDDDKPLIDEHV